MTGQSNGLDDFSHEVYNDIEVLFLVAGQPTMLHTSITCFMPIMVFNSDTISVVILANCESAIFLICIVIFCY